MGAYQCYGDPFFKLVDHEYVRTPATTNFVVAQEAEDALFNLLHKLETGNKAVDTYLEQLSQISQAIDRADIRNASITEKEALIYTELGTYDLAIAKFEELFALEQADYSVSAVETYYLVRCKKCLADEQQYPVQHDAHVEEITKVIEYLEKLKLLKETAQRAYLLGNAYKIKAYLSSGDVRMSSMRTAADHFRRSYEITASAYNLNNWLRMELLIQLMGGAVLPSLAPADIAKQLQEQLQTFREAPDVMSYWDSVMLLNIKLSLLVVNLPVDETDVLLNEVYSGIRSLSGKPGSIGKKKTEKEHLLFLQTALGWSQKAEVGCLSNLLDKLIKEW